MELIIEKDYTIKKIQKAFNAAYPFLKIEFFRRPHRESKPSPKSELIAPNKVLGDLTEFHFSGFVDIAPKRTVAMIENDFWEKFGLSVQVFRKSGNLWIETSLTDNWTLEQQNYEGEQLSTPIANDMSLEDRIEDQRVDEE
ncbi:hypothetical protein [Solitalea lacus]|uniref:hypothetical protein n=1 Tax=Solitalea lacus TaxID=2911172 RepID=UPI001EDAD92E|nr:hypothetical protein [Solitalea lacus]UKJ06726.1 hypothetical protein L2B55_14455 [Solitalea lacus]